MLILDRRSNSRSPILLYRGCPGGGTPSQPWLVLLTHDLGYCGFPQVQKPFVKAVHSTYCTATFIGYVFRKIYAAMSFQTFLCYSGLRVLSVCPAVNVSACQCAKKVAYMDQGNHGPKQTWLSGTSSSRMRVILILIVVRMYPCVCPRRCGSHRPRSKAAALRHVAAKPRII